MNRMELHKVENSKPEKNQTTQATKRRGSVLIVDDNPQNLRALKVILEERDYEVRAAISGQLALDSMKMELPDVVLLDIMMPDKNGYQVCEEMKLNKATKDIPVLFISALDDLSDKIKAFSVGGVDYIPKPFCAKEVLARVDTHVSLYRSKQELKIANKKLKERSRNLEQLNSELSSFSYSVSHDLRAPLRSISGFSQIILEDYRDKMDEVATGYFDTIVRNTQHMEHLIEDILQLSRISQQELTRVDVNLSRLVEGSIEDLRQAYSLDSISVTIEPDIHAQCSQKLVAIAISNLVSNAWKYSQFVDRPMIEFGVKSVDGKKTYYLKDNGIGFDMKYANKIFLPFSRLHSNKQYEGSGIGLATVKRIIDIHHGAIWVDSIPDKGSVFYFRFA